MGGGGPALGQVLPLAVGVALSPVPVILLLTTPGARRNGPASRPAGRRWRTRCSR